MPLFQLEQVSIEMAAIFAIVQSFTIRRIAYKYTVFFFKREESAEAGCCMDRSLPDIYAGEPVPALQDQCQIR